MQPEPWWRGAVIYQIYPRSFFDTDGDGIGDLRGAAEKLDYVASLGVDGVWLSPFFRSPMKDFGYDVSDYCDFDPIFGSLADFDALLARAHALGLKVIIDQVYSHTSDEHPWFEESANARDGPKADWYVWAEPKDDGTAPNNWLSVFGGPAWTWGPRRRQYYLHNFLAGQPDLNFHNPAVQAAILQVATFWLDRGVDGFRLDVANYYFHEASLKDNPPQNCATAPSWPYAYQRHLYDRSQPQTLTFLARLRALTDKYPERMMVGEIGDSDPLARQQEYTAGCDRLHTAYSFHLLDGGRGSPQLFAQALSAWRGADGWPSWSLGNHDFARFATRLGGPNAGPDQINALLAAHFCMRGTIFVYQGDELGLPQAHVPFDQMQDPFAKRAFTGDSGRDGARTPFPWTAAAPMGGFSTAGDAWLPVDPRHLPLAAEVQAKDPGSHLAVTRRLIALRAAHRALRTGEADLLDAGENILALVRAEKSERILCVINLGGQPGSFSHKELAGATTLDTGLRGRLTGAQVDFPAYGGGFFALP